MVANGIAAAAWVGRHADVITRFSNEQFVTGEPCTIRGRLSGTPTVKFDGTPRMTGYIEDDSGSRIGMTAFGDTRAFQEVLLERKDDVIIHGVASEFDGVSGSEILNWSIRYGWGASVPATPGNPRWSRRKPCAIGVPAPSEAAPVAAKWLQDTLGDIGAPLATFAGCEEWPLDRVIVKHTCRDPRKRRARQRAWKRWRQ